MPDSKPIKPPASGLRRLRKALLVLVFSLAAPLVGGELAVRAYAYFFFPKLMVMDDALGWRHARNKSKFFVNEDGERVLSVQNEFGNRGTAHGLARVPGMRRVLILGDSFTEGVHVAENELFSALLEASAPDLEVINTGVGAWGTVQEYLYLRAEGLAFHPDHVILMCYENDLSDNLLPYAPSIYKRPYAAVQDGRVTLIEECQDQSYLQFVAPVPGRAFLLRHSLLFYAFNDRFWQPAQGARLKAIDKQHRAALDWESKTAVFVDVLGRIRELVRGTGASFDLVLIPSKQELGASKSQMQLRLLAAGQRAGVATRSLLEPLREAQATGLRPYFDLDIHFTKAGHVLAAQVLSEVLEGRRGFSYGALKSE